VLAVGMLVVWSGYSVGLWGWCLLRGYNVTLGQLMSPVHPYGSAKGQAWPPPLISSGSIFPSSSSAAGAAPPSSSSPPPAAAAPAPGTANPYYPPAL